MMGEWARVQIKPSVVKMRADGDIPLWSPVEYVGDTRVKAQPAIDDDTFGIARDYARDGALVEIVTQGSLND